MDDIEDNLGEEGINEKLQRWSVQVIKSDLPVYHLYRRWETGTLDIEPEFKRGFVWDLTMQSLFIESVLLRLPVPAVYISEENDGRLQVIDGQQRLTTLFRFLRNQVQLENLQVLWELNGRYFQALDRRLQRRFEDAPISVFILPSNTDPMIKFETFRRLNVGGVPSTAQELRSYLMRGPGVQLVQRLAEPGSKFRIAAGENRTFDRMRADELVLRCLAFLDLGFQRYRGDMQRFLNEELELLNHLTEQERAQRALRFDEALSVILKIFGPNAFRRSVPSGLNAALMDVLVAGFPAELSAIFWIERKKLVENALAELLHDGLFIDAITHATGDTQRVMLRFRMWEKALRDVAKNHA